MEINIKNKLNSNEREIFNILMNVSNAYFGGEPIRAVGGWVRDRLLGKNSNDIDIMLENVSGQKFAEAVTEYLGAKDPHHIKANPDKSKFLETSKAFIPLSNGEEMEVDFAMARQEVYTDDSRVPSIKPATAKEDAFRRDLTINSLFYNINRNEIEDFTGNGIRDLITKTIRTPKEPLETFLEDPLRVFRTIRFASKYSGKIDPQTFEAIQNPKVVDAIKTKLAKERIGQEIKKTLENPNPDVAFRLLKNSGLLEMLLNESLQGSDYEGKMNPLDTDQKNPNHELSVWEHTFQVIKNTLDLYKDAEPEKRIIMLLSALTHDLGKLANWIPIEKESNPHHPDYGPYMTYKGHEDESAKISEILLKYLKLDQYIKPVAALAANHMRAHSIERADAKEKALRKYIRNMGEATLDWMDAYQLSLADALSKKTEYDEEVYQRYNELRKRLELALNSMNQKSQNDQTILDGNELMKELNIKPGPIIREIKEFLKDLEDENPQISKQEALKIIREKFMPQQKNETNSDDIEKQTSEGRICPECGGKVMPGPKGQYPKVKYRGSGVCWDCGWEGSYLFLEKRSSIKTSKKISKLKKEAIECPQPLLKGIYMDIQNLIDDRKYLQAQSMFTEKILSQYPLDERVQRIASDLVLKMICKGENKFNLDVINYVLQNAEKDFADPILNGNAFGILMSMKSNIDEDLIKQLGEKSLKLSPMHTQHVLNQLPNNIPHKKIKTEFLKKIKKES